MSKKDNDEEKQEEDSNLGDENSANELQGQIEELTDDLKRVQADFVNYRKRSEKERLEAIKIGKKKAIESLLPLIDNLERALNHIPDNLHDDAWARGVKQVGKQVDKTLEEMGVEKINEEESSFNPSLHEAVSFEDGEGEEVVEEVVQTGYRVEGEVVRPAMVKVTRKPHEERSNDGESNE